MAYYYWGKLSSDLGRTGYVIKSILGKLDNLLCDENLLFDIRIIMNELVINGCEHGNCFDENKSVRLSLVINDSSIRIQVVDEGEGIRYSLINYNPKSMESGGRGLQIVKELSDELIIEDNKVVAIINK